MNTEIDQPTGTLEERQKEMKRRNGLIRRVAKRLCMFAPMSLEEAKEPWLSKIQKAAFTLVEIMIVVAIIGLLAAIAIPNFVRAREAAQLNSILNNLRIIEGCKDQWALEMKQGTGAAVTWATDTTGIGSYLKGATVKEVVGEAYTIGNIGVNATAIAPVKLGTYTAGAIITQ